MGSCGHAHCTGMVRTVAFVVGEWWQKEWESGGIRSWGMHKVCASGGNTDISGECGVSCVGVVA